MKLESIEAKRVEKEQAARKKKDQKIVEQTADKLSASIASLATLLSTSSVAALGGGAWWTPPAQCFRN